ncbi:hypothetical protein CKM354_000777200 [Cercospora kikuchii]|uniref:F-box domain-containing protein n=1 Tax=Cercospora kikuchii TaxID=84275 RepID=A0A9P3CJX4_9PEZI|nr:uncharacterized protein CKM354_000777200 [Cercospora kikuchii]GIZ44577.1 hypothetical protein CKM354_000777200 [Cercospora kikuchii]
MAEPGAIGEAAALDGSVNSQNDAAAADEGATITEDVTKIDINHKDSLQTLPAELIAEIISHGIGSLEAFRLTCRALRNASQYKWNVRYNGPLRVRFITGHLQRTVTALAPSGCLEKMKAVVFAHLNGAERYAAQKAGKFSEEQVAEFSLLLESLLRELPNLESVAMYNYSGNNLDARASGRALLLLPVLAEVKPSKLEVVTLSGADLPSSLLRSFLQAFEDNLRSLRMEEVRTCDFTMDSTLAFIRDRLRLEFLRVSDMQDVVHSN